ncbi:isochorismatase family protein [Methyloceanibacter sp.]|uniref:isochorismatase family protein n=1 Tax=Methyloceanibacter sp. TaxID=1965321 RepID=UPI002D105841|nr:isochorismatase family protein [Methyloceanibacter sp.]HML91698.1 isochorismatase family protein [Methyloceanibacter sp.]
MLLSREKSQVLIVDVQDKLLSAISGADRVVDRCVRLVLAARKLAIPITMSEQYPQGLGPTHDSVRDAFANDGFVADKTEFSCARNDMLHERLHDLRRAGRSQVVIGGIEAHVCVLQTAMDLESQGFEAFVVADAVGSRSKVNRKLALSRMQKAGVDIVDSEMALFEWMERAGTPEFKSLQALVK